MVCVSQNSFCGLGFFTVTLGGISCVSGVKSPGGETRLPPAALCRCPGPWLDCSQDSGRQEDDCAHDLQRSFHGHPDQAKRQQD